MKLRELCCGLFLVVGLVAFGWNEFDPRGASDAPVGAEAAGPTVGLVLAADETEVQSAIRSVGLFKNGYAVVRRTIEIDADGRYVAADVPVPVHGTFWIESSFPVDARVTEREQIGSTPAPPSQDLQAALEGRRVTIEVRGKDLPVEGVVLAFSEKEQRDDERVRDHWGGVPLHRGNPGWQPNARFIVLETTQGVSFLDAGQILRIDTAPLATERRGRTPVLVFEASEVPADGGAMEVVYLTRGISWAPSYRVDLGSGKGSTGVLTLEQQALIRNELAALNGVDIELISGFPSIEFAHVVSPMAAVTDWQTFFAQLSSMGVGSGAHALASNAVSQVVSYGGGGGGTPVVPSTDGVDTHYQSIGERNLEVGESLVVSVDRATSEFERIVEWTVPDTRNEYGRPQHRPNENGQAWDAVRFENPFDFPMTTAAATVVADDRFRGQRMSEWVNVGEETTLPITKALSVRTVATEAEEPNSRGHREVAGRSYREATVRGELVLCNHRTESVTIVIRRQFSGQLLDADREPEVTLRQEGVASVNPRNELVWTLTLPPGEPQTVTYRYEVLVLR